MADVLLKLCLAPAIALLAFLLVLYFTMDMSGNAFQTEAAWLPAFAPFGSIPVNISAITIAAAIVTSLASLAPFALAIAVVGLALVPAFVGAISAAFSEPAQLEAPALTFLIAASGMTLFGVSGAFGGVVAGVLVLVSKRSANRSLRR